MCSPYISYSGTKQIETLFAERCAQCVSGAAKRVVVRVCVSQTEPREHGGIRLGVSGDDTRGMGVG